MPLSARLHSLAHLHPTWRDAVDILVVAVVIYNLLLLIRGTRAAQMLVGILAVLAVDWLALWLKLPTLRGVLNEILFYLPFAIIVLFAADIRRALMRFGRAPLRTLFSPARADAVIADIVLAVTSLSARRIGALIVLERSDGLKIYIENGVPLDAAVSYELLTNIFVPGTPLHDGAVIISNGRIASAASLLPLTQRTNLPAGYGTRHRAAIGLSEESDALILVVSEERGTVGVAQGGVLNDGLDGKALREILRTATGAVATPEAEPA